MNREDFEKKLKDKFPEEHYSIIYAGKNSYETSKFKCLDCGRIILINTGELFRKRRKTICWRCHAAIRKDTKLHREEILKNMEDISNLEFFKKKQSKLGNYGDAVRFTCNKCQMINELFVANITDTHKCICQYCSGQKNRKDNSVYLKELEVLYPKKFTLLSNYENVTKEIKVRCNSCGFIRMVKPNNLLRNGYCPKCGRVKSLGEQQIANWLENNNVNFQSQKYFKEWGIGLHYFDFYLPDYNLLIEYNGQQHYEYNQFFYKNLQDFEYRKNKDLEKQAEALSHGFNLLIIKYTAKNDLSSILFKILGSTANCRSKRFEIESIHQLDEDLASTSIEIQSSSLENASNVANLAEDY